MTKTLHLSSKPATDTYDAPSGTNASQLVPKQMQFVLPFYRREIVADIGTYLVQKRYFWHGIAGQGAIYETIFMNVIK